MIKQIIAACLLVLVFSWRAAADDTAWLSRPRTEALRLAQEWSLKDPKFVETDAATVETTATGIVVVGRRLLQSLQPSQEAQDNILTFIILHELWHVKQIELLDPALLQDPKERPVLECQADVEAGRLIVLNFLQTIVDYANKVQLASASKDIDAFRASWTFLVDRSPAESEYHHHLTKKQRIVALQFALWRAYFDKFQAAPNPNKQIATLTEKLKTRSDSRDAVSPHDWSRSICERVVTYDAEVLSHLYLAPEPVRDVDDYSLDHVKLSAVNNSARDIKLSATVVSGHFANGKEHDYPEYVFTDSASDTRVIKPGEKVFLSFGVMFPRVPEGSQLFIWQLPFLDQMLLGARYVSAPRPPFNCTEKWTLARRVIDPTLADISRLSSYAADRFNGTWTNTSVTLGLPSNLAIYPATISVRGAIKTEIYVSVGWATATLYEGLDKTAALQSFQKAATSIRDACSDLPAVISEWTDKEGFPVVRVERLSAFSDATLSVTANTRKDQKDEITYQTFWRLQYNPP